MSWDRRLLLARRPGLAGGVLGAALNVVERFHQHARGDVCDRRTPASACRRMSAGGLVAWFDVCPRCGSDDVEGNRRRGQARCVSCAYANAEDVAGDASVRLERLPSVIAIPLAEYARETSPVLRLWAMCDAVEMVLRLLVAAGVADIARGGELPAALRNQLASSIEEPTLGKWRGMLAAVARHLRPDTALPELPGWLAATLAPLHDGSRTVETSLSALRNRLAHGGGMGRAIAEKLVTLHAPRFEAAMRDSAWLAELSLVARRVDGTFGVSAGPRAELGPFEPADAGVAKRLGAAGADGALLVRGPLVLPLWPLTLYGLPTGLDPDGERPRRAVPQVYARRDVERLLLTPLGSDEVAQSVAGSTAVEALLALFRRPEPERKWQIASFEDDLRKDATQRVGRETERARLRAAVEAQREGVLWVTGPAGIGKSFLMAQLAVDLLDEARDGEIVLAYRFRVGDARCSRDSFLEFALERLEAGPGSGKNPLQRLRDLLQKIGKRVVFMLDGLDEVAGVDPSFAADVPLGHAAPGAVWVCAGRPERGLLEAFARATPVFPDGVPDMGPDDVRAMLLDKIGSLRRRLVVKDQEEGDRVVNPFVERVVASAAGLPIYVKYVNGDVLGGRIRAFEERLPPSLVAYHEELLLRCKVGSLQQVLTPLVCTLAFAYEPLGVGALHALLARRTVVTDDAEGRALVERGLAALSSMVRRAQAPDGEDGYALYHHSLREHIEGSEATRVAVRTARESLCDAAVAWDGSRSAARGYLQRHGAAHLLAAGNPTMAMEVLISVFEVPRTHTRPLPRFGGTNADTERRVLDDYERRRKETPPRVDYLAIEWPDFRPWWDGIDVVKKYGDAGNREAAAYACLCLHSLLTYVDFVGAAVFSGFGRDTYTHARIACEALRQKVLTEPSRLDPGAGSVR